MGLDKYYLNLAGEYRVASELLKHGLFATITYGHMKGIDIYVMGQRRKAIVVEVKSSTTGRFVTSFYQKYPTRKMEHPDFWVLYWLKNDGSEEFYVLSHDEMERAQRERNRPGSKATWEKLALEFQKGVDNVLASGLKIHCSKWEKIVKQCSAPTNR
jgi:hypothetical protein